MCNSGAPSYASDPQSSSVDFIRTAFGYSFKESPVRQNQSPEGAKRPPISPSNAVSAENRKIFPSPSHLAPSFGVTPPSNLWISFTGPETKVFQAAEGEDLVILTCTIFD